MPERGSRFVRSKHDAVFLQNFADLLDTGVGQNLSVEIQSRTDALAGFLFHFGCVVRVGSNVSYFVRDIEFVQEPNNCD